MEVDVTRGYYNPECKPDVPIAVVQHHITDLGPIKEREYTIEWHLPSTPEKTFTSVGKKQSILSEKALRIQQLKRELAEAELAEEIVSEVLEQDGATQIEEEMKDSKLKEQRELAEADIAKEMVSKVLFNDAVRMAEEHKEKLVSEAKKITEKNKAKEVKKKPPKAPKVVKPLKNVPKKLRKQKEPTSKIVMDVPSLDNAGDLSIDVEKDNETSQKVKSEYEIEPKRFGEDIDEYEVPSVEGAEVDDDEEDGPVKITNHYKKWGQEGHFLLCLSKGTRMYAPCKLAIQDCKLYNAEHLLRNYMKANNTTYQKMGYVEKVKKSKAIQQEDVGPVTLTSCDLLHNKYIHFGEESSSAYAAKNNFYYGVKCSECDKSFTHNSLKTVCHGK
jgi:hypothetical protein